MAFVQRWAFRFLLINCSQIAQKITDRNFSSLPAKRSRLKLPAADGVTNRLVAQSSQLPFYCSQIAQKITEMNNSETMYITKRLSPRGTRGLCCHLSELWQTKNLCAQCARLPAGRLTASLTPSRLHPSRHLNIAPGSTFAS